MAKQINKISDLNKNIKEEKKKLKEMKKDLKKEKKKKFKKTKLGKIFKRISSFFKWDKNSYSFSEVSVITVCSLVLGIFTALSLLMIYTGGKNYFKLSKELGKFYDAYETLTDNYNGDFSKDELLDSAINGMVNSVGDTYTNYASGEMATNFEELISGVYDGIGCAIQAVDDKIKIVKVYEDSSAFKAGLKEGDLIVSVDSLNAKDNNASKLSEYIKKEAGKKIKIKVIRDKEEKEFTLSRDKVEIEVINSKIYNKNDKKIGYLVISIFSSVSAKQFKEKLDKLEDDGIDALVIDVRNNNGGYLSEVTNMASYLLPKGKILYQMEKGKKKIITKDKTFAKREYPIAILINSNSASAAEILAAIIKESYGGEAIGTKTYGKGTVQQVKRLSDGSLMKYTIENWLTPKGNWINEKGVEPTEEVILSDEYFKDPTEENDNQLQKALEIVSKQ